MKIFCSAALVIAAVTSVTAAVAQDIVKASSPALSPTTKAAKAPPAPVTIDSYVYVDVMPTPTQLANEAEREGLVIKRMDKSADRTVVVYQYPDGRTRAFAYTSTDPEFIVSSSPTESVALPTTPAPTVVYSEPAPTTTVIYREPERVYIYDDGPRYRYYAPARDFWAPLTIGIGLGWGFGHGSYHGGGYRGGWRH